MTTWIKPAVWLIEVSERGGPWKVLAYEGACLNRRSARRLVVLLRQQWEAHYQFRPVPYMRRPK